MVVSDRKQAFYEKLIGLLEDSKRILIVGADNVGSRQFQLIRKDLRGKATILMGKNTLVRRVIRTNLERFPHLEGVLPLIKGNVGFVFCHNEDIAGIRTIISENKVGAPARAGAISPCEVVVPPGNTGMEPTKTAFFQALNIPTKITRGCVEILAPITLLEPGMKVGRSEAALLQMLHINPFSYGLEIMHVCDDGCVYDPAVLDINDDDLCKIFGMAVSNVAAVSLEADYPTEASIPHSMANAFKNLLAVAVETEYSFPQADSVKAYLADPSAFAAPVAEVAEEATEEAEAPAEEEEESSEEDMGFGLFD